MHTGFELIGKPIFGITDGKQIGEIKDLYLDQTLKKVVDMKISQADLLGRKVQLVPREDVMVFGVDSTLPGISMSSTTL
jgi:sporulation protein YlmC with PRC-barrel domain